MGKVSVMAKENQNDKLYHNTRKLLENYAMMKYVYITRKGKLEYMRKKEAESSDCTVAELLCEAEKLSTEVFDGENSMKDQIRWLDLAIRYLKANLRLLRAYPQKGELYCKLLELRYLQDNPEIPGEIMEIMHISRHTYQRRMQEAVSELGNLLWQDLSISVEQQMMKAVQQCGQTK